MKKVLKLSKSALAAVVLTSGISVAAVAPSEVVTLPTDEALGGGDKVGSELIGATYNGGNGPGIWIVADGGYRLYHNGSLLAEDNQAGRGRFIPMTFLPGENAISVVGVNGAGAPGVMVQIDDLDRSYFTGESGWKAKPTVANNSYKNKGRDLSMWGGATTLNYANSKLPSGSNYTGFAPNTNAKWIWTNNESDKNAVLLFNFNVKAEGFGANVSGGDAGKIVVATDSASIRKYLQSSEALTILVPEGTYDFRKFRNAVTEAKAKNRTWCKMTCTEKNAVTGKTNIFYRITFKPNSCADLTEPGIQIVSESENLQQWENWITTKPNKSLVGMGRGANLRGAAIAVRANEGSGNHIYRNLAIYDVNPHLIEGGDGLETVGNSNNHVKKFWADHISYKWISDGFDMEFVDEATISYLDFDGANEYNCWGKDPYMALVEDANLTYANSYWHNTYGRVPKVTGEANGSKVHLYNQYVDGNRFFIAGANGHSSTAKAYVRYENSYINNGVGYLAEWGDNGYVYFSGVTLTNTKQQHRYNGSVIQGIPQAETFTPSYSFYKRDVASLPKDIPNLAGVGGRYGKMPSYNQGFGLSPKAASVTITPSAASYKKGESVTLNASAKANGSAVKSVAFYLGNTLIGTAASSPYQVTATDLAPGLYSAVAVVTDNAGLTWMSEFKTFTVEGEPEITYPTITKCGAGSSSQSINLGDAIVDFCYTWAGAETVTVTGFPAGIVTNIDNDNRKVSISGTPTEAGNFNFKITATANDSTFAKSGRIIVTAPTTPPEHDSGTTGFYDLNKLNHNTTHYAIFDLQGRPLYKGINKPYKMPAQKVIVVECNSNGKIVKRY